MIAAWLAAASAGLLLLLCIVLLRLRRLRQENRELRQAVEECRAQLQAMDGPLSAMRELRHDLRHYLQAADAPLPSGFEELLQAPTANSDILSALLERFRQRAESLGAVADIRLETAQLPTDLLPDLYLLLSNLLENAVEALEREGGGWLRVRSIAAPGYLSVVAGNSCSTTLRSAGDGYLSSKSPGRLGLGLQTVSRIARQYGGEASFTADGQEFRARVFLPLPSGKETSSASVEDKEKPVESESAPSSSPE